jgi:hypothetical protein
MGYTGRIATHTMRQTYYCWSVNAGAHSLDMMEHGRHTSERCAIRYCRGSRTMLNLARNDPAHRAVLDLMPPFKGHVVHDVTTAIMHANTLNCPRMSLTELARSFMRSCGLIYPEQLTVKNVMQQIVKSPCASASIDDELSAALGAIADVAIAEKIKTLISRKVSQVAISTDLESADYYRVEENTYSSLDSNTGRDNTPAIAGILLSPEKCVNENDIITLDTTQNAPPKKKRGGDWDVELRKHVSGPCLERLNTILSIQKMLDEKPADIKVCELFRNFKVTSLDPIIHCLSEHHNNNKDDFLKKWAPFRHSKFIDKCCKKNPCTK